MTTATATTAEDLTDAPTSRHRALVGSVCSCGRAVISATGLCCAPRFGTPRTWSRPTYGGRAAAAAAKLGKPFMPWQQHVADVALEVDPATGRLAYRQVVLIVPRQSGKTTMVLSVATHRAIGFGEAQVIVYTAQTRNDARKKWEDEHVETLKKSAYRGRFTVSKSNGREGIKWKNPRSLWGLSAVTKKSGHGASLDLGFVDEAFAQADDRQEQAMKPAMITRPQPQMWVLSAAGTPSGSPYLLNKVTRGRERELARAASGIEPRGIAYFEWSADDAENIEDPATWWRCMPALGHTITEQALRDEFDGDMSEQARRRAYFSQWRDEDEAGDWVIPRAAWAACADPGDLADGTAGMQLTGDLALAVDGAPYPVRTTSIVLAGATTTGHEGFEVVDLEDGRDWVVDRVLALRAQHPIRSVVLDPTGPAGELLAPLQAAGVDVVTTGSRDMAAACGQLHGAALDARLRHRDEQALTDALAGAARRDLGDAWAWSRRRSDVDISPLVGASLALWAWRAHVATAKPKRNILERIW